MAVLQFIAADGSVGRQHRLTDPVTTLGRGLANTVPMPENARASSRHANIERTPEGYLLRDEQSTNGTWVNRIRVAEQLLTDGDQIQLGDDVLLFLQSCDS